MDLMANIMANYGVLNYAFVYEKELGVFVRISNHFKKTVSTYGPISKITPNDFFPDKLLDLNQYEYRIVIYFEAASLFILKSGKILS